MLEFINFKVVNFPRCRVIGKTLKSNFKGEDHGVPAFWDQCLKDGTFKHLLALSPISDDHVGWIGELDIESGDFTYMVGMLFTADTPVLGGMDSRDIPACRVALAQVQGEPEELYVKAYRTAAEKLKEMNMNLLPKKLLLEVYNSPRYTTLINGECILDICIAVEDQQNH